MMDRPGARQLERSPSMTTAHSIGEEGLLILYIRIFGVTCTGLIYPSIFTRSPFRKVEGKYVFTSILARTSFLIFKVFFVSHNKL